MSGKPIDRTGQKHYMLTFIRKTSKRSKYGTVYWELLCNCGCTVYAGGSDVVRGNTKSCGCFAKSQTALLGAKNRKHSPEISSAKCVWSGEYKDCEFEIFYALSQLPCHYCARKPYKVFNVGTSKINRKQSASELQLQKGDFTYNGLDRIDSSKGHSPGNIVPCCYRCNQAKNDMSREDFLSLVKAIYEHSISN